MDEELQEIILRIEKEEYEESLKKIKDEETENKKRKREEDIYDINTFEPCDEMNDKDLLEGVKCCICLSYVINLKMITECSHSICETCLEIFIKNKGKDLILNCPMCRHPFDPNKHLQPNRLALVVCNILKVKCLNEKCNWINQYKDLLNHIKTECQYLYVCECELIIRKDQKGLHEQNCICRYVKCECGKELKKIELEQHVDKDCPEKIISCKAKRGGCIWTGPKRMLKNHFDNECKLGIIIRENDNLRKQMENFKKSNPFSEFEFPILIELGITGTNKNKLIREYIKTFDNIESNYKFPDDGTKKILLEGVKTDGIFQIILGKDEGICDINLIFPSDSLIENRVMIITLHNKKDRFFVFPTKNIKIDVTKSPGRLKVILPEHKSNNMHPACMVYAYRRWTTFADSNPYSYIIQPTEIYFKQFSLKYSKNNSCFVDIIQKFFQ